MLKAAHSMKGLEGEAVEALSSLLRQVPAVEIRNVALEPAGPDRGADFVLMFDVSGRPQSIVCEVKASGQPRHVRMALLQLRNFMVNHQPNALPVIAAPYLSEEARALCRDAKVGYLDLEGNARLAFDSVFIDRLVPARPAAARRELKSLFKPKSARVLRALLRDPSRSWRVAELAASAKVSLGHVSNVRSALVDREWAKLSKGGLALARPDALLDAWRDVYEAPVAQRTSFYTTLHGRSFDEAARGVMSLKYPEERIALASFSAAQWLAPYARIGTHYFYADNDGIERLKLGLDLKTIQKGENVVVMVPKDDGIFLDTAEPVPGAICTSPVQTYLDLAVAGERGREAADHLRRERLSWR